MTVANQNIIIKTDHLPLLGIMKKPLEKIETKRLMKLAEKLQDYSFTMEYIEGSKNDVADAFSRNPVKPHDNMEPFVENKLMVNLVSEFRGHEMCSMSELKEIAARDNDYQQIKAAIEEGVIAKNLPPTHPGRTYKADWNLLAITENLITLGDRILVPKNARKDIMRTLHASHMGKNKTTELARSLYYWKGMTRDLDQLVEGCDKCQINGNFQPKEPLMQTLPDHPMEMNSVDLAEHNGRTYMIHADRYSNFMWIYEMKRTTTREVIDALWMTFFRMGFPKRLRTDNGPQFISSEFIETCKQFNVEQEWSDPHYPTSNGHAERMVAVAKSMIKKAKTSVHLQSMVHVYNATPSPKLKVSPSEMLMQRRLRSYLPTVRNSGFVPRNDIWRATHRKRQMALKTKLEYDRTAKELSPVTEGTEVRVYNTKTSRWDIIGRIISRDQRTGRSYRILTNNDVYMFRNRRFIKPISRFDHRTKPLGGHVRWESRGNDSYRLRDQR